MSKLRFGVAFITLLAISVAIAKSRPTPDDPSLFRAKEATVITDNAVNYLSRNQVDGKVRLWVFFTDKGILNKQQFAQSALAVSAGMTERAKARRAKHNAEEIRFTDLPVSDAYVRQLETIGARVLRTSKWLNAAAVEIDLNRVGNITRLDYVAKVQPTATFKRPLEDVGQAPKGEDLQKQSLGTHSLSYGSSLTQLTQINVPMCHDSGYAGQGVLISVFDTGFRTTHQSFAAAYAENRVLNEWDFVYNDNNADNEPWEGSSVWSHGTSTWSTCGGENPGVHYGPAYEAQFIICKTEDYTQEVIQEEYNWVAAIEWCDSLGTDIVTSSLGYSDWYVTADYDGNTCVTTIAADIAAQNGILVVNSAGNNGAGTTTINAPADADSIVTVGAVTSGGTLSSFSSRGPSADGRIKPEVCAMGSSVSVASSTSNTSYGFSSGTSFSCPLTAGVAAIVWGANPTWTNMQVREALMMTASNAASPNNNFGWGIINAWAALNYYFPPSYVPGDADNNGALSIADAAFLINYIFAGGAAPTVPEAADADCNGAISIADAVFLINYIFAGGPIPTICP